MAKIKVRVKPNAKRFKIRVTGEFLTADVPAPPVEGKANRELIRQLSKLLDVPQSSITIKSGHKSRVKVLQIEGISDAELAERLKE